MLIICSGPDTFRAREKATELVAAYRKKYDAAGLSVETVDGVEAVAEHAGVVSLFATRRCIRVDGALQKLTISKAKALAAQLARDVEGTIVIDVEEDVLPAKTLEALKPAQVHSYPFPLLVGESYRVWVRERGRALGTDERAIEKIAQLGNGDTWWAVQELTKQSAFFAPDAILSPDIAGQDMFQVIEGVLRESRGWRTALLEHEDPVLMPLASQARALIRARDGFVEGIHPFVVKKMQQIKRDQPTRTLLRALSTLIAARTSLTNENESDVLL